MSKRATLRATYMEGWYHMDAGRLLSSTAPEFVFDDPAEPAPVTRDQLVGYMHRWDERTRALGSTNRWRLSDQVRQDRDGVLTDWEWWELLGTPLCGAALIRTSDAGVLLERITYFERQP